ncbi:hypothetical protein HYDPIDRAFT_29448 [Hydnomerulius pinastri MD-312]|uniref:Uncharacterized protein n=1 Tax=Hydnomerulius pinastri MD-312 TaxID=994086 RepID=A0A0C9WE70_9AGAM|nr:hypothetical protein HYDPIDRAFT_29448 [Hydnomerulius pinastri MD-312]
MLGYANIPLLAWIYDPRYLAEDQQIVAILDLLRDLRMSPMNLLLRSINARPNFQDSREDFLRGKGLFHFLNTLEVDTQGKAKINEWIRSRALDVVCLGVNQETERSKDIFLMSSKQITPEYLLSFDLQRNLTEPLQERTPWLGRVLFGVTWEETR